MDIKTFNTLKTILEVGSFQKAAQKLNYTQSTVTFQMQQLEQELGIKLFEKIGRKMMLTQAGKDILPCIDEILIATDKILNYGKNISDMTGELKVALPETLLIYKMQPVIKAFREQAPNVKLILQSLNCFVARENVISGYTDIGIHYDVGGYNAKVKTEVLSEYDMALIASPELPKEYNNFINTNQRKPISLINNDPNSIFQTTFDNYIKEKDIVFENLMELGSIEAIKRCVMSNLGVSFLPRFTVNEELENGQLQELETELSKKCITLICAYHENKWISPAMRLFIKMVRQELGRGE